MMYPTREMVEEGSKLDLVYWNRYLPPPGSSHIGKKNFEELLAEESDIVNLIAKRLRELGMDPQTSKKADRRMDIEKHISERGKNELKAFLEAMSHDPVWCGEDKCPKCKLLSIVHAPYEDGVYPTKLINEALEKVMLETNSDIEVGDFIESHLHRCPKCRESLVKIQYFQTHLCRPIICPPEGIEEFLKVRCSNCGYTKYTRTGDDPRKSK